MYIDDGDLRGRLSRLSLEDKVALLTGADMWTLRPAPQAGLGTMVLSDGPSGVRGRVWDERRPSLLFPNTSALAATWDPESARAAGWLTGAQARDKGVHVLLAPTVNLHRTPLGGRHFECYSEDPLLTARMATAFVAGVQSAGVAATVKHFVGNDSETARMTYDARIGERPLRELYLRPFEEAVGDGVWAVMAAYNGVNGVTMTENRDLLTGVLKDEWGFDGVVVSDWTAARSTEASAGAGLDLVMPGPRGPWGGKLVAAVREGRVAQELIDDKVLRLLRLAARVGILDGVPGPPPATTPDDARGRLRDLAARACVLLRNDGILPLPQVRRIALLGPAAERFAMQGGGSAHVNPADVRTPYDGLRCALGTDSAISVHAGVYPHRLLPPLPLPLARDPETGEPGFRVDYRDADGALLASENRRAARLVFLGTLPESTREILVRTEITPESNGEHEFGVCGIGSFELRVGPVTEKTTLGGAGGDPVESLMNPPEQRVRVLLAAGRATTLGLRHMIAPDAMFTSFGLGYAEPRPAEDEELQAAVTAARDADVAIVVVGTNEEVESEGFDRTTLALPGRQDELVSAVAAANPRTVVVVNAGAPVLMPWRKDVAAVLWAWLPGQEGGDAIADVLTGVTEPGGRLPTTFPVSPERIHSVRPVDGRIEYAEEGSIGYRHYEPEEVAYPFGHGLGYTTWSYDVVTVRRDDAGIIAEVALTNTGPRNGREVVQCYVTGPEGMRLAGFGTVEAEPGEQVTALITLDDRAVSIWDGGWRIRSGTYRLHVGRSAADLRLAHELSV